MKQPPKWLKKIQQANQDFWEKEYPKKSADEKRQYWQEVLEKAMTEQEKQGLGEYDGFNNAWHGSVKEQEPNIDEYFKQLFDGPWADKNQEAFWAKLGKENSLD